VHEISTDTIASPISKKFSTKPALKSKKTLG